MLLETGHLGGYANSIDTQGVYELPVVTDEANNNNHNNNNNEIRNNPDENGFTITRGTSIQDFYADQSIFITGGTGFLGKVLIEKLLRSCPKISTIYMLIRMKKNKSMEDRIEELYSNPLYDRLKEELPKFRHKIVGISGDCSIPGLGLSSTDRERLIREVSIVFHSAATVRFDERLDSALAINVRSTLDMIDLCKQMNRLKAFMHVSTAYANCHLPTIEESFYPHITTYEEIMKTLEGLEGDEIAKITPKIIKKWPNTYTFTKALAEDVVRERSKGLCVGVFRPAVIISAAYEPTPSWTDNFYGPAGAVIAVASGILRAVHFSSTSRANVIPVDMTANALIATAWDVANQPERREEKMLIYNYVSTTDYNITWGEYCRTNMVYGKDYPLSNAQWALTLNIYESKVGNILGRIAYHYIPAVLIDFCSICLGHPPKLLKAYKRVHHLMNVVTWFCIRDWTFTDKNVLNMWHRLDAKDRQIFRFSIRELNWDRYWETYLKGIRVHLLKDDLSNLEASKKRAMRYTRIHETMKAVMMALFLWGMWKIIAAVFF